MGIYIGVSKKTEEYPGGTYYYQLPDSPQLNITYSTWHNMLSMLKVEKSCEGDIFEPYELAGLKQRAHEMMILHCLDNNWRHRDFFDRLVEIIDYAQTHYDAYVSWA
jgi:hypothetical protein